MSDADFHLVNGLFCRLVDKEALSGPDSLTAVEAFVVAIWHASGIIGNGGLQYFYEQDLDAEAVAAAYDQIGCPECAEVLRLSWSLFPEPLSLAGRDERVEFVENHRELFEPLDHRFWECDTQMPQRLAEYVRTHGQTG